ncbi:MAG: hypothetical protein QW783_03330 [Candidatus Micrarchaeia archaeon]
MFFRGIINLSDEIKYETFLFPVLLFLLFILARCAYVSLAKSSSADKYYLLAFTYRSALLAIILILAYLNIVLPYAVYDDETYSLGAAGYINNYEGGNLYSEIIKIIYYIFGNNSINGRFFNIFLASISVYPLYNILINILKSEKAINAAIIAYIFLPYDAFWSVFEVKDILLLCIMIFYIDIILNIEKMISSNKKKALIILYLILILLFGILAEGIRRGTFFLMSLGAFLNISIKVSSRRKVLIITILVLCLFLWLVFGLNNITVSPVAKYRLYQYWIKTQIGQGSIYNWFLITEPSNIWKLPFTILAYIMSPFPTIRKMNLGYPFFLSFGSVLKIFSIPCLLLGMIKIRILLERIRFAFLVLFIPLLIVSMWNFTNFRQGIAYLWIFVISYGAFIESWKVKIKT